MATKKTPIKKKTTKKPVAKKPVSRVKKVRWEVLSPDGFAIHREDTYPSVAAAKKALAKWAKRFEQQGYYASVRGRIALKDLPKYCSIVPVK